ncbi:hypothetical protein GCM10007079_25020 [Nocardiopsis terrae]|nr:hypothetical protein GCM10007079_25020 [Nocardiopsis terrae]
MCRRHVDTKKKQGSKLYDFGRVLDGDWDLSNQGKRNTPLEETVIHQSVFERYANNTAWEDLPVFEHKLKAIREQGRVDGCRSRADLVVRYRRLDDVYERLRDTGWQLEEQVGGLFQNNVSVSITRNGGFLLGTGGAHRLSIAKFLRLPAIEVYVLSRHVDWIAVRRRAECGQGFPHPDLEEFGEGAERPSPAPAPPSTKTTVYRFLNRVLSPRMS